MNNEYLVKLKDGFDPLVEFYVKDGFLVRDKAYKATVSIKDDKDNFIEFIIDEDESESGSNVYVANTCVDIITSPHTETYECEYEFVETTRKLKNGRYGPVIIHDNNVMLDIEADYATLNEAAVILEQIADFILEEGEENYGS